MKKKEQIVLPELPNGFIPTQVNVYAVSRDQNHVLTWDGISENYDRVYSEPKYQNDLYKAKRPT